MPNHPLAEVFGYPTDNFSAEADHCRQGRLCPFKEKRKDGTLQRCNKDKKDDPLGVCSVFNAVGERVITCPVRFQQEWLIAQDAAGFFFPSGTDTERITEVRLTDQDEKSVGSIDVVLLVPDTQAALLAITHFEAGDETRFIQRISTKAEKARKAKDGDDLPEHTLDPNL